MTAGEVAVVYSRWSVLSRGFGQSAARAPGASFRKSWSWSGTKPEPLSLRNQAIRVMISHTKDLA